MHSAAYKIVAIIPTEDGLLDSVGLLVSVGLLFVKLSFEDSVLDTSEDVVPPFVSDELLSVVTELFESSIWLSL